MSLGERDVTGEGEESSLQTGLGESLRTVCEHTSTAFVHDAHPLTLEGDTESRYKGINFHDPFWIKSVKSEAHLIIMILWKFIKCMLQLLYIDYCMQNSLV